MLNIIIVDSAADLKIMTDCEKKWLPLMRWCVRVDESSCFIIININYDGVIIIY